MENQSLAELADSVATDVVNSLDVPDTLAPEGETQAPPKKKKEVAEQPEEVEEEEEVEEPEVEDEEDEEEESEEEESAKEDEEVVPKSKHDKILKRMERRLDSMNSELQEAREKASKKSSSFEDRLESMSLNELRDNYKDITIAIAQNKSNGQDLSPEQISKLVDAQYKVQDAMNSFKDRFWNKQTRNLERILPDIEDLAPDFKKQWTKGRGKFLDIGMDIFRNSPSFKNSETGLAEAFGLAMRYVGQGQGNKGDSRFLKRQVGNLKRKTSLSGRTLKPDMTKDRRQKSFKKAVNGSKDDKAAWVHDEILPQLGL